MEGKIYLLLSLDERNMINNDENNNNPNKSKYITKTNNYYTNSSTIKVTL